MVYMLQVRMDLKYFDLIPQNINENFMIEWKNVSDENFFKEHIFVNLMDGENFMNML